MSFLSDFFASEFWQVHIHANFIAEDRWTWHFTLPS